MQDTSPFTEKDVQAAWNDGQESVKDEPLYILTVFNRKPDGLDVDMEIMDERPTTDVDPDNWPDNFEVRVAHINGGDSRLIEQRISGITTHKEPAY